jgi:hypothetical protein
VYLIITRKGDLYFLADATVNIEPTAEDLAEIALCAAQEARRFDVEPRIGMLSFSSFGSTNHPLCEKVRRATQLVRYADPTLIIDGEVQGDIAVNAKKLDAAFPFSSLRGGANVLIFPNLEASNIACKLLGSIGGAETVGPILMGMAKPVHLLQRGVEVEDVVNMTTIAVVDAQDTATPAPRKAVAVATRGVQQVWGFYRPSLRRDRGPVFLRSLRKLYGHAPEEGFAAPPADVTIPFIAGPLTDETAVRQGAIRGSLERIFVRLLHKLAGFFGRHGFGCATGRCASD